MTTSPSIPVNLVTVRGTELLASDTRERYRQKLARITLDSMVQFVGLLDAKGTVLEINHVALDAVGITLADVEGKPFWTTFWWQVSAEVNATLRESILRASQGEFVRWDAEIYGRAGGKETIIIDASLMPVKDEQGNVVFITAEGRDITEKKAQEREIAQKNEELQALLLRINELDEIKNQFFANVSHELRTPLALILGPAERLLDTHRVMSAKERVESSQVIARNARLLLKHVNDLLDISKLEAGKLRIAPHDLDVAGLVRFTASHFDLLAESKAIRFQLDVPKELFSAVDPAKFQRVLMNLLSNAFKFTPNGGQIGCALRIDEDNLVMSVDDSGPGVRLELRRAVFDRFRQGEGGSDRRLGGTGLGLAIANEFVELHRGQIGISDSDLGGACFQVSMPHQRLADANRIKAGEGIPISVRQCRLDQVVASAVKGIQEVHGPRLRIRNEAGAISGHWDYKSLRRVIENLAGNALKYDSTHAPVTIVLIQTDEWVELGVHNEGNPIAPEDQHSLFQLYRRPTSAVSGDQTGWGVGLTLVKGITEAHGGTVRVESSEEHGTTFFIRLPMDSRAAGSR